MDGGRVGLSTLGARLIVVVPDLPTLVGLQVCLRNSLHPIDLDLDVTAVRLRVGNLVYRLLVDLHAVDGKARPGVKLLVADVTLEMFRLLMLNQYFLIVKLAITIPET